MKTILLLTFLYIVCVPALLVLLLCDSVKTFLARKVYGEEYAGGAE